jgi:hypothetical protein
MLLITTFVELRAVAGRSRTRAGRTHAVSERPMLNHTCHATCHAHSALCVGLEKSLQDGVVVAWHGRGMAGRGMAGRGMAGRGMARAWHGTGVAWHGRGMAGRGMARAWHGMC